jgi:hypothetical protein
MAYLRKENETVEIDYPLGKVWAAIPKALAILEWTIKETDDATHHAKAKTKGAFMSYPSTLIIDGAAVDEKTARLKVTAETPVTTITSIADFGRTRDRIDQFYQALAKQLTKKTKKPADNSLSAQNSMLSSKETIKHGNAKRKRRKAAEKRED